MARAKKAAALTPEERLQAALVPDWEWPYKLPENWCWTKLGVISAVKGGKRLPKGRNLLNNKTVHPYIRVTDFDSNSVIIEQVKYIDEETFHYIQNYTISSKDIYISIAGTIGKVGIIPDSFDGANLTENAAKITDINGINQKYLLWVLNSEFAQLQMKDSTISTTQPKLALFRIENIEIPIPPLAEQQRIVERIESLFAKLDEAKEKAQTVLDSFETRKAAILHKAFTGELTAKWREAHGVGMESWESVPLSNVCTVNPKKVDTKNLPDELEVSFFPMPALSEIYGEITEPQTRPLKDVRNGFTNFSEGDVVFAKITPCMENGKSAVIGKLINGIGFGTTEFFVLRCSDKLYNRFVYHLVRGKSFRDKAKAVMTGAVGQQRVPKSFLENYLLHLPEVDEQKEIVRILDDFFAKEQQAKEAAEAVLDQIDLMKKSILARALRGELGTNVPNDEPAVELLKKII